MICSALIRICVALAMLSSGTLSVMAQTELDVVINATQAQMQPQESGTDASISAKQLVVMINGRFPTSGVPEEVANRDVFPTAQMASEIEVGEGVYLFVQPGGNVWSGNNAPEKVRVARTTEIEVESNTVIPGLSGGAALDEGLRIVGIIIETDNGVARSIPVRRLKEIIESGGYPFMLQDAAMSLPNIKFDPLEELTKRGYSFREGEMAAREFAGALNMGRQDDAKLFIAAGIPLPVNWLVILASVPNELVDSLLHENLLYSGSYSSSHKGTLESWCDDLIGMSGVILHVEKYAEYDNRYLFQTACNAQALMIKDRLQAIIQGYEEGVAATKNDQDRLEEIKQACRKVLWEYAPLEILGERLYKAAFDLDYDTPNTYEIGLKAQAEFHKMIGDGQHIEMKGFASVYGKIDSETWSWIYGRYFKGRTIYHANNKPFMTIEDLFQKNGRRGNFFLL